MALLTEEIKKSLPALYSQEENKAPLARLRFVDTLGDWNWYVVEFDGENLFFGLVLGFERELGYFTLSEFEAMNRKVGFERIQLDPDFTPVSVHEIQR